MPGATQNHLVLLAENLEGYHNLIKLVSAGYTEGFYYKPRIDKALLAQHSKGLIGLSSCLKGEVAEGLSHQQERKAIEAAAAYRDILGPDNFFLEMQWHGIEEQRIVNSGLPAIAKDLGLPLICTNDVHYLQAADAHPHDILLCIGTAKAFSDPKRLRYDAKQFFLKTADEMAEVFKDYPDALANTMRIAERCNVKIARGRELPARLRRADRLHRRQLLRPGRARRLRAAAAAAEAARARRHAAPHHRRVRAAPDLRARHDQDDEVPGYFLIVWDFIRHAREKGIPVGPGRGSAAGSLVAYCMRITDVDPIDFDLIFERFLNPERISLPDIDIDFCERRRGEVIEYVTQKYGREKVAQIITFGTMKAKAVVRDVGRVLEMPFADVDKVAKQIPPALDMTLDKALEESETLPADGAERPEGQGTAQRRAPARGHDPPRLGPRRRRRHRAEGDHRVRAALQGGARRNRDPVVDEGDRARRPPEDGLPRAEHADADLRRDRGDQAHHRRSSSTSTTCRSTMPKTYQIFQDGQTYGIFQFESSGMRDILRKSKPQRLDDLIALNALYRPGPLRSGMVDDYIARKQGKTEIKYELPELEPILADTYGVIAYQEQVMRISNVVAGFTLGEADLLRKAMGKKNAEVMAKMRGKFVEGAKKLGTQREEGGAAVRPDGALRRLRLQQVALDRLRVPRVSDRVSQGELPVALRGGAADDRSAEHRQARAVSRRVPRPRHSGAAAGHQREPAALHGRAGKGVRFGLTAIKNVGEGAIESLLDGPRKKQGRDHVAARALRGSRSAAGQQARVREPDQGRRVRLARARHGVRRAADAAAAAAADRGDRRGLRARRAAAARPRARARRSCSARWRRRRRRRRGAAPAAAPLPEAAPWTETEQLGFEKETLGLYWSGHPVDRYADALKLFGAKTDRRARRGAAGRRTRGDALGPGRPQADRGRHRVGGIVAAVPPAEDAQRRRMAVFTLEDAHRRRRSRRVSGGVSARARR